MANTHFQQHKRWLYVWTSPDGQYQNQIDCTQRWKHLPPMWETRVRSLGQEDPLEKEMAIHSSILSWRIPWTEKPSRLQSTGSQRVGHDWATSPRTLCSRRWRSSIQSAKTRLGADCSSDHELLITKFRLKLKKVGKTARPFRYDLNQIPYDYTVEVRNIFKGLDPIDRVPDELWNEVRDIVQETGIKTIPMEKKCKKAKWLSEEAL